MKCQKCGGTAKLYEVQAKCSDLYYQNHIGGKEYDGYVPEWIGQDGYGDYVNFTICRHCGQVQGDNWPHDNPSENQFRSGKAGVWKKSVNVLK